MTLMPVNSMDWQFCRMLRICRRCRPDAGSLAGLGGTILMLAALFLALIVLLSLVNAFFTAGAIGMARQALDEGKADTGAMWSTEGGTS